MTNQQANFEEIQKQKQQILDDRKRQLLEDLKGIFTTEQSEIIANIFLHILNIQDEQEESAQAHLTLTSTVEAFYDILVTKKKIIDAQEFDQISSEILGNHITRLNEYIEQLMPDEPVAE